MRALREVAFHVYVVYCWATERRRGYGRPWR